VTVDIGNQADELLYRLTEELPEELEVIETYYTNGKPDDGGEAFARMAFQGRIFKITIEPEGA
jgi:hypothetical protein